MSSRTQLWTLFITQWIARTIAMGMVPLVPIDALAVGASPAQVGYIMAFALAVMAGGTMATAWLAARLGGLKRLLLLTAALSVPVLWLLARGASSPWALALLASGVWFFLGLVGSSVHILAGLASTPSTRGKAFAIVMLGVPAGVFTGGLAASAATQAGSTATYYAWMMAAAVALAVFVAIAVREPARQPANSAAVRLRQAQGGSPAWGREFVVYLAVTLLGGIAPSVGRLGTSLAMESLRFEPAAVASTLTIGGLVSFPLIPIMGWLADRLERRYLLIAMQVLAAAGLFALLGADALWQFWLSSVLMSASNYASGSVAAAFATDLLPRRSIAAGLSLFNGVSWLAGIAGFALTGTLVEAAGANVVFAATACLPLLAALWLRGIESQCLVCEAAA